MARWMTRRSRQAPAKLLPGSTNCRTSLKLRHRNTGHTRTGRHSWDCWSASCSSRRGDSNRTCPTLWALRRLALWRSLSGRFEQRRGSCPTLRAPCRYWLWRFHVRSSRCGSPNAQHPRSRRYTRLPDQVDGRVRCHRSAELPRCAGDADATMTTAASHARHQLEPAIHSPVRFSIVAVLTGVDEAEFSHVRDTVEISDPVLSKQASSLEAAGYVKIRKGYVGKRPRTWLSLTKQGRQAFARHVEALRVIASGE